MSAFHKGNDPICDSDRHAGYVWSGEAPCPICTSARLDEVEESVRKLTESVEEFYQAIITALERDR